MLVTALKSKLAGLKLKVLILAVAVGSLLSACDTVDVPAYDEPHKPEPTVEGYPFQVHEPHGSLFPLFSVTFKHRLPNRKDEVLCVYAMREGDGGGVSCDWVGLHKVPEVVQ